MDKLRRALSGDDQSPYDEESNIITQVCTHSINDATTLSKSTRFKGFVILFLMGILMSFLGSFFLFIQFKGLIAFAVFYTLGNICSMGSTCFLMGPVKQLKKMFAPTRVLATVMVIVMFCLTLFAAFVVKKALLALIFVILQSLALTWYSLSYIPYARKLVKDAFTNCLS
ncbi:UNVERIFIED_CONTAM: hypothetical protein PYX00_010271 [Menopon gallinae]|uniref:Vesicle transport protein n=1 Tax=Menopon gallinae TaxID=328185 RepID=A0AAW2HEW9_9NEOP